MGSPKESEMTEQPTLHFLSIDTGVKSSIIFNSGTCKLSITVGFCL